VPKMNAIFSWHLAGLGPEITHSSGKDGDFCLSQSLLTAKPDALHTPQVRESSRKGEK
jgi:hypothetical protein